MTEPQQASLTAKAQVLKALAHPTRLWILEQLAAGECCVCVFVEAVAADFSTVSKHLAVLKRAGLVVAEKRGKQVFYRLRVPCVLHFLDCLEQTLPITGRPRRKPAIAPAAPREPAPCCPE